MKWYVELCIAFNIGTYGEVAAMMPNKKKAFQEQLNDPCDALNALSSKLTTQISSSLPHGQVRPRDRAGHRLWSHYRRHHQIFILHRAHLRRCHSQRL